MLHTRATASVPSGSASGFRGGAAIVSNLVALVLGAVVAAGTLGSAGAEAGDRDPVRLRSGPIAAPESSTAGAGAVDPGRRSDASGEHALVVLWLGADPETRRRAEARGVSLQAYLGDGAYLARVPADAAARRLAIPAEAWTAAYPPARRVAPELLRLPLDDPRPTLPVTVHLTSDSTAEEVAARVRELRDLGVAVGGALAGSPQTRGRAERHGRIVALPTPSQWVALRERIAAWDDTLWVGRRPAYRLLNDSNAWIVQSGLDAGQSTPLYEHGLTGEDQVIAVLDTGLDADMCYFRDDDRGLPPVNLGLGPGNPDALQRKVTIVNFLAPGDDPADPNDWDSQNHGTHVAGSALGDNPVTPSVRDRGDGMAPAAKLVVQDGGFAADDCADLPAIGCPAADLYPFFEQAYLQGARIHSNSYGDRENFTPSDIYSEGSQAADAFTWDHPDFLLVFAAGNGGPGASSIASPATAKNVLAVGAALPGITAGALAGFSSRGPAADGRIKPDVIAPGALIVSAANDGDIGTQQCATRSSSGTSMSCPTVAGVAALARQYYTQGFYPSGARRAADAFVPSAALLKATLIASSRALEREPLPPPSNAQGWGGVVLDDALYLAGDSRRSRVFDVAGAFVAAGDADRVHGFDVLAGSEPLVATLVWTDYPSNPMAATNLVNDLDLELVSPAGAVYRGNVFGGDGASLPDAGAADTVNNVEVVRIADAEPGAWVVRVRPRTIAQGAQGYALVVAGGLRASGPTLTRVGLDVDDSHGGNADGIVDPGEWIDLDLTLLNVGDAPAAQVSAELASLSPGVQVIRPQAALPDIAPDGQAAAAGPPLRVRLDPAFPCTEPLRLQLTYIADGFRFTETVEVPTGTRQALIVDDFESATGWAHSAADSSTVAGAWVVGAPDLTQFQPGADATPAPGVHCLFTASNPGGVGAGDVDGGVVVARSGSFDLTGHPDARVSVTRWFGNRDLGEDPGDAFRLAIRQDAVSPDIVLEELGTEVNATLWTRVDFRVADFVPVGPAVELSVSAADPGPVANIVEAAIDDVTFWEPLCEVYDPPLTPPNPVDDLRVSRSGTLVVLGWSRPPQEPDHAAATRYGVFASTAPGGGFELLGTLADAGEDLQSTHAGAAPGAPPALYYLVISGNAAGDSEVLP